MNAPVDPIYLDYAATTPLRDEVRAAMEPYYAVQFGNPSSPHRWGRAARGALEESRARIAEALGARHRDVVFVRGGTESDNLAILGRAEATRAAGGAPCIVTSATEHKAVLDAARSVAARGGRAVVLPVLRSGVIDLEALDRALDEHPCLVSLMWVNNETGVVQPVPEVAARAAEAGVPVHTDAVQAVGKVPVHFERSGVACLSVTGHKIYGPKSTGALLVHQDTPLDPRLHGGGQERGLRPGTQDVAGAVGLAEAVCLAVAEQAELMSRYESLRQRLEGRLSAAIADLRIHGGDARRSPHVTNVGIANIDGQMLTISLDLEGLAVSGGSACQSGSTGGSHVLEAMYGDDARSAIRFSFGRTTTDADVDRAADIVIRVVERLRPHDG
ncbi:cysteine desulfurase family protein [Gaopeijia maritima]|uniref:Cysteine desulfurase family protein n=1 Tax=Gaopeijia maritima TaxID=3119007 RepID=A0ABU9EDV0_9BACT